MYENTERKTRLKIFYVKEKKTDKKKCYECSIYDSWRLLEIKTSILEKKGLKTSEKTESKTFVEVKNSSLFYYLPETKRITAKIFSLKHPDSSTLLNTL